MAREAPYSLRMVLICWQRTVGEGPCSATEGEERARENRAQSSGQKRPMAGEGGPGSWLDVGRVFCQAGWSGQRPEEANAGRVVVHGRRRRKKRKGRRRGGGGAAGAGGQGTRSAKEGKGESGGRRGAAGSDARSPPVPSPSQQAGPSGEEREGVMGHGSQCIGGQVPPSCDPN